MRFLQYIGGCTILGVALASVESDRKINHEEIGRVVSALREGIKNKDAAVMGKYRSVKDIRAQAFANSADKDSNVLYVDGVRVKNAQSARQAFVENEQAVPPSQALGLQEPVEAENARKLVESFDNATTTSRELSFKYPHGYYVQNWNNWADCGSYNYKRKGYLLNRCTVYGDIYSYILKVNLQDDVLVELDYDNDHCGGVPSKVYDILDNGHYSLDQCDGTGYTPSYINGIPTFERPAYRYTWADPEICEADKPFQFNEYGANVCYSDYWGSYLYDAYYCPSDGDTDDGYYYVYYYEFLDYSCTDMTYWSYFFTYECEEVSWSESGSLQCAYPWGKA